MSRREKLSKKTRDSIKATPTDDALAGNMDLVVTAHAMLTRLGYRDIEVMDLLSAAHFLAGGDTDE